MKPDAPPARLRLRAPALLAGALLVAAVPAAAQMSLLPPACAQLRGEALDRCVRDLAQPVVAPGFEEIGLPPPDPAALANCTRALAADRDFCIGRNEILVACGDRAKHPDLAACFARYAPNLARPAAANCAQEPPPRRAACAARNAVFERCLEQPLGYFLCLATQAKPVAPADAHPPPP